MKELVPPENDFWTPSMDLARLNRRRLLMGGTAAAGLAALGATFVRPTAARAAGGTMTANSTLALNQELVSGGGAYRLIMQGDGNLVVSPTSHYEALWASRTANLGADRAVMQSDGNFVVYAGGQPLFNTGTAHLDGAQLSVQDDGNLVLYVAGQPVWNRHDGFMNTIQPLLPIRLPNLDIHGKVSADQATSGDEDETTDGWIPPEARNQDIVKATAFEADGRTRTTYWKVEIDWGKALTSVGQAFVGGFVSGFAGASIATIKNPESPAEVLWNLATLGFRTVAGIDVGLLMGGLTAAGLAAFPPLGIRPFEVGDSVPKIIPTAGFYVRDGLGGGAVFPVNVPRL